MLTFYYSPISGPSNAVRTLLLLSKVQYNEKIIELGKGEQKGDQFTKINPNQAVPALTQGEFKLFESQAIMRYIAETHAQNYYPKNDIHLRAKLDSFLDFIQTELQPIRNYMGDFVFGPIMRKTQPPDGKDARESEILLIFQFIEKVFLGNGQYNYIANSPTLTIADISFIFLIQQLNATAFDFSKVKHLKTYVTRIHGVPEVQRVNKDAVEYLTKGQMTHPQLMSIFSTETQIKVTPQASPLILYIHPFSPPSRAVRALLQVAKVEYYTEKVVDLMKGEQMTPEFTAVNPNQAVPVITQGPFHLFESCAILRYISNQYSLTQFYPKSDIQLKAKIDSFLDWQQSSLGKLPKLVFDFVLKPQQDLIAKGAEYKKQREAEVEYEISFIIQNFLGNGKSRYIADSKTPSIADLIFGSYLVQLLAYNFDFDKVPLIKPYFSLVMVQLRDPSKEYISFVNQMKTQFNPFISQILNQAQKKKGCC